MHHVPEEPWRPTREQIAAAKGTTIRDVLAPDLDVLFCGINPGLYSGATGHHFARPGNRFWSALHGSGFTDRLLSPFEDVLLPTYALGVTNLVERATAAADELSTEELRRGGTRLVAKLRRFRPGLLAVVGVGAYRTAFERPRAVVGLQDEPLAGVPVWVLPNTSGLNAHYRPSDMVATFAAARRFAIKEVSRSAAGSAALSRTWSRSSSSAPARRTRRTSRSPR